MESLPPEILFGLNVCQTCKREIRVNASFRQIMLEYRPHCIPTSISYHIIRTRLGDIPEPIIGIIASVFVIRRVSKTLKQYTDAYEWSKTAIGSMAITFLGNACYRNQLESAGWLVNAFNLDTKGVFEYICLGGVDAVKWFTMTYSLTGKDMRANNYARLRNLCRHGREDIILWLVHSFQIDWDPKCARIAKRAGCPYLSTWIRTEWREETRERQKQQRLARAAMAQALPSPIFSSVV